MAWLAAPVSRHRPRVRTRRRQQKLDLIAEAVPDAESGIPDNLPPLKPPRHPHARATPRKDRDKIITSSAPVNLGKEWRSALMRRHFSGGQELAPQPLVQRTDRVARLRGDVWVGGGGPVEAQPERTDWLVDWLGGVPASDAGLARSSSTRALLVSSPSSHTVWDTAPALEWKREAEPPPPITLNEAPRTTTPMIRIQEDTRNQMEQVDQILSRMHSVAQSIKHDLQQVDEMKARIQRVDMKPNAPRRAPMKLKSVDATARIEVAKLKAIRRLRFMELRASSPVRSTSFPPPADVWNPLERQRSPSPTQKWWSGHQHRIRDLWIASKGDEAQRFAEQTVKDRLGWL